MDDPRAAEGVEHLQAAAKELLLAARSFLNVVEEVVEDRERFAGMAGDVVGLLRGGLEGVRSAGSPLQPWEQAAWQAPAAPDPTEEAGVPDAAGSPGADAAADVTAPVDVTAPARSADAAGEPEAAGRLSGAPRRVRRIAVD